jgi:hypothetical protein
MLPMRIRMAIDSVKSTLKNPAQPKILIVLNAHSLKHFIHSDYIMGKIVPKY